MAIADAFVPDLRDGDVNPLPRRFEVMTADGAVPIADGIVFLNKAGALAATIDSPPTSMNGAVLRIVSLTDQAHTVTYATVGFNGDTTSGDVATFANAAGNAMELVAYNGVWYAVNLTGVTLA